MVESLRAAGLISAIGIGLIFGLILLLWGLMALVVRVTAARGGEQPEEPGDATRARAAAAAVGAYLASERRSPPQEPQTSPPGNGVRHQ